MTPKAISVNTQLPLYAAFLAVTSSRSSQTPSLECLLINLRNERLERKSRNGIPEDREDNLRKGIEM